ncbi:MAG: DUF4831 family protein [Bacteroidales bacterium]|nr:DUF4831 family protein [Bacteroidales bacterium]
MKNKTGVLILLILFACSPVSKINVTNIQDLESYQENSIIYSIPRTRLVLTVTAVRHYTVPGPYNKYAEKYIGIENAPSVSEVKWELNTVALSSCQQPDPDYCFSVQSDDPELVLQKFMMLTGEGMILKPDENNPFVQFEGILDEGPEPIHFKDLSVKRNLIEPGSSAKSAGKKTTVDLAVTGQNRDIKSIEQKAQEAANFIIKIRKRRFKLLAGQYEVFPEGKALEISIQELNHLEEEYISLFAGKTYSDTITRSFYYIPQVNQEPERYVFFRFSDETGFHDALGSVGKPLVLELRNMHFTQVLQNLHFPLSGPTYENVLFYRIPDMASVKVFYSSNTILEAEIKIFQYGSVVPWSIVGK